MEWLPKKMHGWQVDSKNYNNKWEKMKCHMCML
jgi:hypothetical protein